MEGKELLSYRESGFYHCKGDKILKGKYHSYVNAYIYCDKEKGPLVYGNVFYRGDYLKNFVCVGFIAVN